MNGVEVRLRKRLGDFTLDVQFQAPPSGITALFGHSGSGKTSILRAVAGLDRDAVGHVRINGNVWQDSSCFLPAHRRPVGYVFQEASLFPHLSVKANLEYGWKRTNASTGLEFGKVVEVLGIEPLLKRATQKLSGGERQRVAIARALLTSPSLLLLDEPLSALDHAAKRAILPYLQTLNDEFGIPGLYVSHDPKEVAQLADHMILLERGKVIAAGSATDLLTRLDLPLANYDDASAIIEGEISAHDDTFHLTWVGMHGGRVAVCRNAMPVGKRARVEILAKDVSLALKAHTDTSIQNILPATIVDTHDINPAQIMVRLELEDGQLLISRITRRSAVSLGIREGMQLYAQVKSVALIA
ncbi:MAG: molybdenum ABC transporter ATP-binding protein [Candidatus Sedimenticola endophacoides]